MTNILGRNNIFNYNYSSTRGSDNKYHGVPVVSSRERFSSLDYLSLLIIQKLMKSLIFKLLSYVSIIILLTSSVVINSDNKCNVTIKITDISVIKGDIYIAIYDNQNAFDNKNAINSKRLKVTSTKEEYTVSLPIGEYAVILYQDLNKIKTG